MENQVIAVDVLSDIRIHIRTLVGDQTHAILVHEVIGRFVSVREMVNVFHPVDEVCEGLARNRIDLTQMKD